MYPAGAKASDPAWEQPSLWVRVLRWVRVLMLTSVMEPATSVMAPVSRETCAWGLGLMSVVMLVPAVPGLVPVVPGLVPAVSVFLRLLAKMRGLKSKR